MIFISYQKKKKRIINMKESNMKEKLTKEQALKFHRQMWSDMKEELGENPSFGARLDFKEKWCIDNCFVDVDTNCFLCEYAIQHNTIDPSSCNCLINWEPLTGRGSCTRVESGGYSYANAPISKILELPERKIDE